MNLRDETAEVGAFTLELIRVRELFREPGRCRDGNTSSSGDRRRGSILTYILRGRG